jgi:hypothetical protein
VQISVKIDPISKKFLTVESIIIGTYPLISMKELSFKFPLFDRFISSKYQDLDRKGNFHMVKIGPGEDDDTPYKFLDVTLQSFKNTYVYECLECKDEIEYKNKTNLNTGWSKFFIVSFSLHLRNEEMDLFDIKRK